MKRPEEDPTEFDRRRAARRLIDMVARRLPPASGDDAKARSERVPHPARRMEKDGQRLRLHHGADRRGGVGLQGKAVWRCSGTPCACRPSEGDCADARASATTPSCCTPSPSTARQARKTTVHRPAIECRSDSTFRRIRHKQATGPATDTADTKLRRIKAANRPDFRQNAALGPSRHREAIDLKRIMRAAGGRCLLADLILSGLGTKRESPIMVPI